MAAAKDAIVMYLVLRRDLLTALNWPLGALVTQGCHAATAVIWQHKDDEHVKQYMAEMDSMRKVTLEVSRNLILGLDLVQGLPSPVGLCRASPQ